MSTLFNPAIGYSGRGRLDRPINKDSDIDQRTTQIEPCVNPNGMIDEEIYIPVSAGLLLAARIWRPANSDAEPVPAILEYIPYRKRDGTRLRDEKVHPYFTANGYSSVRVDTRDGF